MGDAGGVLPTGESPPGHAPMEQGTDDWGAMDERSHSVSPRGRGPGRPRTRGVGRVDATGRVPARRKTLPAQSYFGVPDDEEETQRPAPKRRRTRTPVMPPIPESDGWDDGGGGSNGLGFVMDEVRKGNAALRKVQRQIQLLTPSFQNGDPQPPPLPAEPRARARSAASGPPVHTSWFSGNLRDLFSGLGGLVGLWALSAFKPWLSSRLSGTSGGQGGSQALPAPPTADSIRVGTGAGVQL